MDQTPNLRLPYIAPSQAQKHVTHNEAIRALDALVQLSVISSTDQVPPAEPAEGDRYIVPSAGTGEWSGKDQQVAAYQDGAWAYFQPGEGWQAWIAVPGLLAVFSNGAWKPVSTATNPVDAVGIRTTADDTNRLALKSPASLFDHAGAGHQLKINKAGDSQAASLLFQANYQGRAELGTMWGRDFRIKTSIDGIDWHDVLVADNATGEVRFPGGIAHKVTGKKQSSLIFLPPSKALATIYQMPVSSGTVTKLASVTGDTIVFASNAAAKFFATQMRGGAMVRIWNTSKSPAQPAWAKWDTRLDSLQVSDASHVRQWAAGDLIQIVDPQTNMIAIDISPMMRERLGSAFAQDGVLLSVVNGQTATSLIIPTWEPSPVSESNLVYVSPDEARTLRVTGIYG